jgi:glycine/D-amino acid oxidase-like deaminating enzyme
MIDYLIVGLGLAGVSFCEQLEKRGKTYKVISDSSQTSSIVAGGLYNPVILKRFTMAWNADEQLKLAKPFYASLEKKLNVKLDYPIRVLRRFASVEEQNLWFEASDKPRLKDFLSPEIVKNKNLNIDAPFEFGKVLKTGRIDVQQLLSYYLENLLSEELLMQETFDYAKLHLTSSAVSYKSVKAKQIVFAEGFGMKQNPYFNYLPLTGTKGEYLIIKAPNLKESNSIKSNIFIIPWKDDLYRVGATYKWKDTTNLATEVSRIELLEKLKIFLKCDFEVVDQLAGIRPTVTDRRPLVGQHPKFFNLYILNGFGSRGVMIAPFASEQLLNSIEKGDEIHPNMNISRFTKKHFKN